MNHSYYIYTVYVSSTFRLGFLFFMYWIANNSSFKFSFRHSVCAQNLKDLEKKQIQFNFRCLRWFYRTPIRTPIRPFRIFAYLIQRYSIIIIIIVTNDNFKNAKKKNNEILKRKKTFDSCEKISTQKFQKMFGNTHSKQNIGKDVYWLQLWPIIVKTRPFTAVFSSSSSAYTFITAFDVWSM